MASVDQAILQEVAEEYTDINKVTLEKVITEINLEYSRKNKGEPDFLSIRNNALSHFIKTDLFEHSLYKSAVGKYYARRKTKPVRREKYPIVKVTSTEAEVKVFPKRTIVFKTVNNSGRSTKDVDLFIRYETGTYYDGKITNEIRKNARRDARVAINQLSKRVKRKKR